MQFNIENGMIHFATYDTYMNQYAGKSVDQTVLSTFDQPKRFSDFSLAMPVQVLNAQRSDDDEWHHNDERQHDHHDFDRAG